MLPANPRPNGRPKWLPTRKQRAYIRDLASGGYPQEVIAKVVGVSRSTLKRRCPRELHEGTLIANARLAAVAFEMAVSGEFPEMTLFLLKCRVGMVEPSNDHTRKIVSIPLQNKPV